jgi:tetratricopeptide (TPR) repeat protein
MREKLHVHFLIGCLYFGLAAGVFAATNSLPAADATNAATQNALAQIQEQLRAAQTAIADIRAQDQAEAATNTAALTVRIESLEQTVAARHAAEIESAHKAQDLTLLLAAAFALAGLAAMLLVFYFQLRAFSQFAEISARQVALNSRNSSLIGVAGELTAGFSAPARATVETSNTRLLTLVERLEKRVVQMEQAARHSLPGASPGLLKTNGHGEPDARIRGLLADGQTLLNAEQPENALKLFEEALYLDPQNADVLVKKGGALERMNRIDDAIACYDRAIELDPSATMAWLQKGGLFNRLARYDEAMQCYEKALQAQDKAA